MVTLHEYRNDDGSIRRTTNSDYEQQRLESMPKLTNDQARLVRQWLIRENLKDVQVLNWLIWEVKRFMSPEDSATIRHRILDPWGKEVSEEEWQMNSDAHGRVM
jgi:hypothetical protein